ncbi:MAG: hypothetical protein PHQ28_00095 [Mycobacterium sp.]|nr:hypothetical protein [Mycobacterium sp.]
MSQGIEITVYVNQGEDRYFRGYQPGDPLAKAAVFTLDPRLVAQVTSAGIPTQALEFVWEQLNVDHPTEVWAHQYRADRHPSLSVGDVIVIGETAFGLSRFDGWKRTSLNAEQIA